jgi:hypothetical protein
MRTRYRRAVMIGLGCLYLGAVGFLSGMLVERIRFDLHRTAVLTRLAAAEQRLHARLMDLEPRIEPSARGGDR